MAHRLKSNIKYVWWDLVSSGLLIAFSLISFAACAPGHVDLLWKFPVVLIFAVLMLALGIFCLVDGVLNWQWVTVHENRISVRCVLFEIRSIPIEKIKRCWVCKGCLMTVVMRNWNIYRDCIVIDTVKTRKQHTIPDGFSRRKYRYIILPDTLENRAALRSLPPEVIRDWK